MRRWLAALFALALCAGANGAAAQERILNFVSDVEVQQNGDLIVAETITVQAEGREIRRGILRDFPTTYRARDGRRVVVGFQVLSVMRNGNPESYSTERLANGVRARIGNASRLLPRGEHTYLIRYRTTRQVGFFGEFDELYWNATGTGWTFPIDRAEARILLPAGAQIRAQSFYTGAQGERGADAVIVEQAENRIVIRTTRPLPAREGLTVAVAWQKGIVDPPTRAQLLRYLLRDNLAFSFALAGLLAVFGYYAFAWFLVGRDPPGGTIIPMFGPPAGMNAAAVRYVDKRLFDDKAFTAAIVELGVKGHLRLKEAGSSTLAEKGEGKKPLDDIERDVKKRLFGKDASVELVHKNHERIGGARTLLHAALERLYEGRMFTTNNGIWGVGFLFTILAVILNLVMTAGSVSDGARGTVAAAMLAPLIFVLGGAFLFQSAIHQRRDPLLFAAFSLAIAAVPAAIGLWFVWHSAGAFAIWPVLLTFAVVAFCGFAFEWLEAPSVEGRRVMDHIEGLRDYMELAEDERLDYLNPPEKTPELFEKLLPYAIALDAENAWGQKFAGVLAAAAAAGTAPAVATWYATNTNWSENPLNLTNSISGALSQTIASSSTPPGTSGGSGSSSSGSFGGGSSGGGGGGGGGSGW
jgi:uncharacterized membrane protein YgcG